MTLYTPVAPYKLSRKNGSFPKTLNLHYRTYNGARAALRRYARKVVGGWGHAQHVPLAALSLFNIRIAKEKNNVSTKGY